MAGKIFREADYVRLRGLLRPDPARIADELVEHPQHLTDALEILARAGMDRDALEFEAKSAFAIAAARVRTGYEERGEKKPAEAAVSQEAALDDDYLTARDAVERAELSVKLWGGLVEGLKWKGSSLKRLAELTVAGYLAPNAASSYEADRAELADARRARRALRS